MHESTAITPDKVRLAVPEDIEAIRTIVEVTLFPGELLDEMMASYLDSESTDQSEFWLVHDVGGALGGVACCAPEPVTDGTWNLKALAVAPERQRAGVGRALLTGVERTLIQRVQRLLVVDTSSADEQRGARAFYERNGYICRATIPAFWGPGEDKIVFTKLLVEPS